MLPFCQQFLSQVAVFKNIILVENSYLNIFFVKQQYSVKTEKIDFFTEKYADVSENIMADKMQLRTF